MRQRWHKATESEITSVVLRLRQEDIEECYAMFGVHPQILFRNLDRDHGQIYSIVTRQGRPVALAGVHPLLSDPTIAQIWMCATEELLAHQMEFLKYSRPFIEEVSAPFRLVYNYVDARNEVHLKWLKWCGFTFINELPRWGAQGRPFYTFLRIT